MDASMQAHAGALDVQMDADGFTAEGLSRVPTRRMTRCGRASDALTTGVPQTGQNFRIMRLPESALLRYSVSVPARLTDSTGKTAFTVAEPAAQYWQSRHQQWRTVKGFAVAT
jgi:hypothetical protein